MWLSKKIAMDKLMPNKYEWNLVWKMEDLSIKPTNEWLRRPNKTIQTKDALLKFEEEKQKMTEDVKSLELQLKSWAMPRRLSWRIPKKNGLSF